MLQRGACAPWAETLPLGPRTYTEARTGQSDLHQGKEVRTENQSAAAKAPGQPTTVEASSSAAKPARAESAQIPPRHPPSSGRRAAIVMGSASLVTLGAWGLLSATLPSPNRSTAPGSGASTNAPTSSAGAAPANVHTLVPLSAEELAAVRPTIQQDLPSTNQNASSACPEVIARLSLIPTSGSKGQLRVISGAYTSPWFQLPQGPFSFAIPFPSAYQTGQGMLVIEGNAQRGVLALTPALDLNMPSQTTLSIPVIWEVKPNCK